MEEEILNKAYKEIISAIADNVKHYRLLKNWSQEDLAYSADIDRTYIGYIENGKNNVSIKILLQLAIALDVNISDLLS